MVGDLLLVLVGIGLSAFLANRIYVGVNDRQIDVKNVLYSRSSTPIAYCLVMIMALAGLSFGLLIVWVGIMELLG